MLSLCRKLEKLAGYFMVYVETFWSREEGSVVKEKNKKRKRFNRSSKFESIWAWISDQIVYICRQFRRNCIHLPKTFLNAEKLAEVRIYLISRSNDHIIWWLKKSSSPLAWLFFILMGEVHLPKRLKGWMGLKKKKKEMICSQQCKLHDRKPHRMQ